MSDKCNHERFEASVAVNRILESKDGPVERICADVRISCVDCGVPLRFIGLPFGVDLNGAAVSSDGEEARLAVAPKGEVLTLVEGCSGFTIRKGNGE